MINDPARPSRINNSGGVLRPLFVPAGDDLELVERLKEKSPGAAAALYDKYAEHVQRVLVRILGFDAELEDLLNEVFVQALGSIRSIEDGNKLKGWLTIVTVHTARAHIRRRVRKRWLQFKEPALVPDAPHPGADHDAREMLRSTYEILDRLPEKERVAFTLRHFDGMELSELAEVTGVSLATAKRVLARAGTRFAMLARRNPALAAKIEQHAKWGTP